MSTEREIAEVFKALSDENRIHILRSLRDGEKCACSLLEELSISQPTLSHHMKILCDSGLVEGRREGKWMHYTICPEQVCRVGKLMQQLLCPDNTSDSCDEK